MTILRSTETLFTEFYHASTTNQRKAQIELEIKSLLSDPQQHWRIWIDALAVNTKSVCHSPLPESVE